MFDPHQSHNCIGLFRDLQTHKRTASADLVLCRDVADS